MSVRIVFILGNGQYISTHQKDRDTASEFIKSWYERHRLRFEGGDSNTLENQLLGGAGLDGRVEWAVLANSIIGMYLTDDAPTAADRLADAQTKLAETLGKQVEGGEEWRGE